MGTKISVVISCGLGGDWTLPEVSTLGGHLWAESFGGREKFPIFYWGNGPLDTVYYLLLIPTYGPACTTSSQSIRIPECVRLIQVHFTLDMSICLAGLMSPSKCMRGRPHPSSRSGAHVQRYLTQDHFLSILGPLARYSPCGIGPPFCYSARCLSLFSRWQGWEKPCTFSTSPIACDRQLRPV